MGADIHTVIQIKKDGKWQSILQNFCTERNYETFSLLAGVRSSTFEKPTIGKWGLPEDFAIDRWDFHHPNPGMPEGIYWMGDGSFGSADLARFKAYNWDDETRKNECYLTIFEKLQELADMHKLNDDEVRIVYGFCS